VNFGRTVVGPRQWFASGGSKAFVFQLLVLLTRLGVVDRGVLEVGEKDEKG
jgi:hypothetical protein